MAIIYSGRGRQILVDDADYEFLNAFNWNIGKRGAFYHLPQENGKLKQCLMHRMILGIEDPSVWVKHKDKNMLNNRRSNLTTRVVSRHGSKVTPINAARNNDVSSWAHEIKRTITVESAYERTKAEIETAIKGYEIIGFKQRKEVKKGDFYLRYDLQIDQERNEGFGDYFVLVLKKDAPQRFLIKRVPIVDRVPTSIYEVSATNADKLVRDYPSMFSIEGGTPAPIATPAPVTKPKKRVMVHLPSGITWNVVPNNTQISNLYQQVTENYAHSQIIARPSEYRIVETSA